MSLFLAATDERISAAIVSGYMSSWSEAHKMPWNMCGSQVLPGMLGRLEHVDLGALVAPRPLLVESGREDDIFPVAAATKTVDELRSVYEALGAEPDALVHDVFEGGHQWHGELAYPFLGALARSGEPDHCDLTQLRPDCDDHVLIAERCRVAGPSSAVDRLDPQSRRSRGGFELVFREDEGWLWTVVARTELAIRGVVRQEARSEVDAVLAQQADRPRARTCEM